MTRKTKPIPKTDRIYDQENKPIPKTDRIIAHYHFHSPVASDHHKNKKNRQTITRIPDGLCDEVIAIFLPKNQATPSAVQSFPIEKQLMGLFMFSRQDVSERCYRENMILGPPAIDGFRNGFNRASPKGYGLGC